MADEQLSVVLQLVDQVTDPLNAISGKLDEFGNDVARLGGTLLSLDAAFKVFETAADASDKLQDVSRALTTFTGSATAAGQALAYFSAAQDQTRSTALQLADMYTRVLPLGIRQGWDQAGLQQITVQLDQLATAAGVAGETLISSFTRLLSAGVSGSGGSRNALLQILGLTGQDLQNAGDQAGQVLADAIAAKITALGGSIPDSLKSAWEKSKDDLETALGTGFSAAFGQDSDAMRNLRDMFKDPTLLQEMKDLGTALGNAVKAAVGAGQGLGYWLSLIGKGSSAVGEAIGAGGGGALNPGNQASLDAIIAGLRLQSGYGSPEDYNFMPEFAGGGIGPLTGLAGSGGVTAGSLGGNVAAATDDISKLNVQLQQLTDNYDAAEAAGVSLDAFAEQHAAELIKLSQETAAYGVQVSDLVQWLLTLADATRQLPQSQSLTKFLGQQQSVPVSFLGIVQNEDGSYSLDPGFSAAEDLQFQNLSNRTEELQVQAGQWALENQTKALTAIAAAWKAEFANAFGDVFSDIATTGGQNLGKILEQQLANTAKQFGTQVGGAVADALSKLFQGGGITVGQTINPQTGLPYTQAEANAANSQSLAGAGALTSGVFNVAALGYQFSQGGVSPLQGAFSGAAAGAQIGGGLSQLGVTLGGTSLGLVGGLIGAFVGALVSALTEAMPSITTYAVPVIKDGFAQLTDMAGEILSDPSQQQAWLQKIQDSFDQFRNGYANILLSLPDSIRSSVLPGLQNVLRQISSGSVSGSFPSPYSDPSNPGGGFLSADDWQAAMNNWLNSTLPSNVQQLFKGPFEDAFEAMGGTLDKFNEIWQKASSLGGQQGLQYLNDYFSTLGQLQDLLSKLAQPTGVGTGSGLYATTLSTSHESLAQALDDASSGAADLVQNISMLTGESQIQAAQQLNTLIQNRYQLEQQMIQQIVNMIQSAESGLSGNLLSIQLRGKTPQQQYSIYQQQLPGLETQLGQATNPTDLTSIYNQIVNNIMTSSGLFPNNQSIQAWATQQLTLVEGQYEQMLRRFGQQIDQSNQQFTAQVQPVVDLLTTTLNTFGVDLSNSTAGLDAVNAAASATADSLGRLGDAAEFLVNVAGQFGYTAQTRRARRAA